MRMQTFFFPPKAWRKRDHEPSTLHPGHRSPLTTRSSPHHAPLLPPDPRLQRALGKVLPIRAGFGVWIQQKTPCRLDGGEERRKIGNLPNPQGVMGS